MTVGCSGSTDPARIASCGPIVTELLDPNEGHVLAGVAMNPTYRNDPPTSGPHIGGLFVTGVQAEPVPKVTQVSTLEAGAVIIQFRSDRPDIGAELAPSAGARVVVAPATALDAAMIATGWATSMRCDRVDLARLDDFIAVVAGRYVGHGSTTTLPTSSPPTSTLPTSTLPTATAGPTGPSSTVADR